MNTPKPTLKNLQRGLVAIYHGANQAQRAIDQLDLLLSIVWPNDIAACKVRGTCKYYFKSKIQEAGWDAANGTDLVNYPVSLFLKDAIQYLQEAKAAAEVNCAEAECLLEEAMTRKTNVELTYKSISEQLISAQKAIQFTSVKDAIVKDGNAQLAINDLLNKLDLSTSVEDFCNTLNKLQTILKQIQ